VFENRVLRKVVGQMKEEEQENEENYVKRNFRILRLQ
jgi:hypothetical protein